MKFGFDWSVSEEKTFEECGRRTTTDGWTDGVCLYFKLTYEPKGSGELTSINY